jgi:hypothetical protein
MNFLKNKQVKITFDDIKKIRLTEDGIFVETKDGKIGKELFTSYPRLKYATPKQRKKYTTSALGIHWEELDEDLSFEGFFQEKENLSPIGKIFSQIGELNISAFARRSGISQPLMAAYLNGTKIPGENRKKEIEKILHELGKELIAIKL